MKLLRYPLRGLAAFLVTAVIAIAADESEVDRIVAAGRDGSQVMDHLDYLTNRIGPRLTGSDGLQNACEWARDQFQAMGLTNARLEKWGEIPVGFNRGPWFGRVVEPEPKLLQFGTAAWSAGTKGVTRGRAVLAPENEEQLSKVRDRLAGAWVVSATAPPAGRGGPGGRPGAGGAGPARPADGAANPGAAPPQAPNAEFRQKLDAIYNEAGIAGTVRPVRGDLILTSGNSRITWDKLPARPSINLLQKQWEEVVGMLRDGKEVVLEFDIRNYFRKGPVPVYNVIADIPGTELPDEYVIVGGHIDSWDGATGATDNGTGCATTLEAARILVSSGVKPRRTIRFMLWSGEEQGLLGSRAYVRAHPELMPKISAVLVHDGGTNYLSGIGATEAMLADMEQVFARVKTLDESMPFAIRKVDGLRGGGSDHASFLSAGVPGFFWGQAGRANYTHTHHTQFDTFDAAIPEYQKHSSIVVALGATGIANLDHLLSREKLTPPGGGGGQRRTIGVQLDELTIVELNEGGVAEKAGLLVGDVFVSIDGTKIADRTEFTRAISVGGAKKKIVVQRDGKDVEVIAEWPAQ
jgi:carboxypeptidase Q